jgi:hypothetical protein
VPLRFSANQLPKGEDGNDNLQRVTLMPLTAYDELAAVLTMAEEVVA